MAKKYGTDKVDVVDQDNGDILFNTSVAYLSGAKAAITFSKDFFYEDKNARPKTITIDKNEIKYIPWGDKNNYPQEVIDMVEKNPVASPLVEFKIDLSYGSGIKLGHIVNNELIEYTLNEILSNKALRDVHEFIVDNNLNSELSEIFTDINWFYQSNIELILNKEFTRIAEISAKESVFSRYSEMEKDGKIKYHLYSAQWDKTIDKDNCVVTELLDLKKPGLDLKRRMGIKPNLDATFKAEKKARYIYPIRYSTPGRKYYPSPYWHSIIKSGWLEFANAIPSFKKAMMTNSLTVKYHVQINAEYFPRIFVEEGITKKEDKIKRKIKEYDDIQKFLIGEEQAGKPIISYFKTSPDGKIEIQDIKITPIEGKIGGEYIEDSREASAMIYTAFNVHPNLVGVIPSKNSSNLSGSDKRELLRIAQTFQVRKRDKVLELLELIKQINKWPQDLIIYISDIILTTLDQGKEIQEIITT